jgi:ABC-type sugar transport system substrate-binding protein
MTLNRRTLLKSAGFASLAAATGARWSSALADPTITVAYSQAGLLNDWRVINQKDMEASIKGAGWNFITANADSDPAKQLSDVQSLLAQRPTVLVLAPQESAALAPAVDMCDDAGIPLLVIDRTLAAEPGKGMYKAEIVQSHFDSGVLLAQKTLELLKKKNGAPKGNVVRVMGFPGASTVIDPGNGWKSVMKDYPDIKVVGQGNGQYNKDSAIKVMQDLLQRFPKGQIDVVWSDYSDMTIGAIEVIKTAGRDELLGYIVDEGGHKLSIEAVIKGEIARDTQTPPYFGKEVVENVKKLAAGEPVEAKQPLKIKVFDSDKPEEAKAYLAEITAKGLNF